MNPNLQQVSSVYFFVMLITLGLAILLIRYTVTLRRYLKEFTRVSKKVSNKEFHTRFNTYVKGELGELSKNFNYMIQIMDSTIEEVEYKHLQLTSIVKSVSHGILAIDIKGKILLINDIAKEMLKCDIETNLEGINFKFVVGDKKILETFQKYVGSTQNEVIELNLKDNLVYRIKIDPVYLQDSKHAIIGSIINIEDITELVKLENMRKDFVANVSHELKTPLTVILANIGILQRHKEDTIEQQEKWVENTKEEAVRMKRLVEDMLELARADAGTGKLHMERLNISDLAWSAALGFESVVFEQKKMLDTKITPDLFVNGDPEKLTQLLVILIDNACKYSEPGGTITVALEPVKNQVKLTVHNTGSYIEKEMQEHLFERFYRGDASRSREAGGYGLGLAIAKEIVSVHKGKISVRSEKETGTAFEVAVPAGK